MNESVYITKSVDLRSFSSLLENEAEPLDLILKGHHGVENLLNASLIEAMPESDALEVSRIAFLLKADLLIALGLLPKKIRPIFNRLNSYRNKFAHDPHYRIDDTYSDETSKLLSSLAPSATSEFLQENEKGVLLIPERRMIFCCWATCLHTLAAACKKNIAKDVSSRAIATMAERKALKNPDGLGSHWMQCEAELLIERYPSFFSQWPTHIELTENISESTSSEDRQE